VETTTIGNVRDEIRKRVNFWKHGVIRLLSSALSSWWVSSRTLNINVHIIKLLFCYYTDVNRSLTLNEGHKLQVFENIVFRKIFEPKNDEEC